MGLPYVQSITQNVEIVAVRMHIVWRKVPHATRTILTTNASRMWLLWLLYGGALFSHVTVLI